ncbi:MAG: hypothetical protein JNG86_08255 [Verrucomicrobiaceae bacterium]|nr:hypothetical protein [Verrucomicrobiaceae bacterium]
MTQVAIQLPDELGQFVHQSVRTGGFQDANEFFVSFVASLKEQTESPLTTEEQVKLTSLRADIQHAVAQVERGEIIRDFKMDAFLQERHREHAASAKA